MPPRPPEPPRPPKPPRPPRGCGCGCLPTLALTIAGIVAVLVAIF